jgi:nucleotide-binding universal stress UspA family protein
MRVDAAIESIAAASPAEGLHRFAADTNADLIAVGATRRDLLGRVVHGDDAHDALSGAPCPVAVAPRGYATRWHRVRRIGIGYDGSAESEHALGFARELARRFDAALVACTVVSLPSYAYPGAGAALATAMSDLLAEAERRLRALGGIEVHVTYGVPAEELARFSGSVDLLVIGSRDYGAIGRLVHGSTAQQLAHTAEAPLLVLTRAVRAADAAKAPEPTATAA